MDFNFTEALVDLGADTIFQIANQASTPDSYFFNSILPETNVQDYKVTTGDMTIRATMAGLAGESGPYAPGGQISTSKFLEETAKIANRVSLQEGNLRKLQQMVLTLQAGNSGSIDFIQSEVLNFFDKVILQGHFDTFEWLRAQALVNGNIDWTFNSKSINIDYGVPTANMLPAATGTSAYDSTASTFWADIRKSSELLRYNVRVRVAHIDTMLAIIDNVANNIEVTSDEGGVFTLRRLVGSNDRISTDSRDFVQIVTYQKEGELINPADPSSTIVVPFMPKKKILCIGRNERSTYRVGEGTTADPKLDQALGYTHIGPTVEGGGSAGRFGRLYTPENRQWELVGEGVTNGLPVIEAPKKLSVLTTEIDGA